MARAYPGLFFVKTLDGGPPAKAWIDLKGGAPYYEGQVLRLSATSGSAAKAANGATHAFGVAGANIATASATTTRMPVYLANANNVFEGRVLATGAPKTRLYDKVTIRVTTTHNYRIQGTALVGNATACLRIIDVHPDDASGTASNKRYWVQFITAKSLVGDGSNTL